MAAVPDPPVAMTTPHGRYGNRHAHARITRAYIVCSFMCDPCNISQLNNSMQNLPLH